MTDKSTLRQWFDWLFAYPPTTTAYDDAMDATRLTADEPDPPKPQPVFVEQPIVIPEPAQHVPQHMRDVAGVAHVRLVDIPKISRKSAVRRKAKAAAVKKKKP